MPKKQTRPGRVYIGKKILMTKEKSISTLTDATEFIDLTEFQEDNQIFCQSFELRSVNVNPELMFKYARRAKAQSTVPYIKFNDEMIDILTKKLKKPEKEKQSLRKKSKN